MGTSDLDVNFCIHTEKGSKSLNLMREASR